MVTRLVCVFLVLVSSTVLAQRGYDTCTTPDRQPGLCITLRTCPALYSLVSSGRPLTKDVTILLQRLHCGFEGSNPKVCCATPRPPPTQRPTAPSGPSGPARPPRPTDEVVERIKDVRGEPNLQLLSHNVCGPTTDNRIIGGNKTAVNEFPWMARLGYTSRRGTSFRCGGSLINNRYVLTAAHCVEGLKSTEKLTTVRLGETDILSEIDCSIISGTKVCAAPVVDIRVEEARSHPQFSTDGPNRLQNDIALVRLASRVQFTDSVKPICLPIGEDQVRNLDGRKVIVSGWGTTETGYTSPELLKVQLPVVPGDQCVDVYRESNLKISPVKQVCAGGSKLGDSCNGDSGGPLKFPGAGLQGDPRIVQYGIVSFGPRNCGTEGMPGVYTRVGYYMQWILRNLRM